VETADEAEAARPEPFERGVSAAETAPEAFYWVIDLMAPMEYAAVGAREVVVTGPDSDVAAALDSRLDGDVTVRSAATVEEVRTAATVEEVRTALEESACVVATGALPAVTCCELVETVRASDPDLPVVVYPQEGGETLAGRVSAYDATTYVPRQAGYGVLAERVDDALAGHERRRRRREQATILEALFEQFPYHLYVKDEAARYVAMTDVADVPDPGEVIGKTDVEVYSDAAEGRESYRDDLAVIETDEPVLRREDRRHADDVAYWVEVTKVPWRDDDGETRGLVGAALNVTERKELEATVDHSRTLHRRIVSYLAHDVRNPLNLAHGHLDLAQDSPDPEHFEKIRDALGRIEAVVDNMDVVIGDAGLRDGADGRQARLAEAVTDAWETVDTGDATLRSDVPGSATVLADRSPLQELFENLFRNSVEHAAGASSSEQSVADAPDDGGRGVTVRVGTLPGGFYVADDGVGLSDDIEALCEHGTTTSASNTGLGLAIVTEIADTYGWTVDATESADGGARFELRNCRLVERHHDVEAGASHPLETSYDAGDARPPGSAQQAETAGSWVVSGGGENVWRETNEHHFVGAAVDGDVRVTCRLTALDRVEEFTKAGVVVRDGPASTAPFGFVGKTADHGSEVLWRPSADAHTTSDQYEAGADLPRWYRLERVGDSLTAFVSPDGETWTAVDQRRVELSDTVHAGLAVCSHDPDVRTDARFDDVAVTEFVTSGFDEP